MNELTLSDLGVRLISLRRASGHMAALSDSLALQGGDTLVLSGKPTALALAEAVLLAGP